MNLIIKEVTPEELEQMAKKYTFRESKEETVQKMFEMLKTTTSFYYNLTGMTYKKHDNGDESVECFFEYSDGSTETVSVNVTADSCTAIIQDVWRKLYTLA